MTEDELARLAEAADQVRIEHLASTNALYLAHRVPTVIAEVRRLQALEKKWKNFMDKALASMVE